MHALELKRQRDYKRAREQEGETGHERNRSHAHGQRHDKHQQGEHHEQCAAGNHPARAAEPEGRQVAAEADYHEAVV